MLTSIEIDGFKSFQNFRLEFQPFTSIVGPNASGKSNLFDALQLLSRLAQKDINTAMTELRGEPSELFRKTGSTGVTERRSRKIRIGIEALLPSSGKDAFGQEYTIKSRRIGYMLQIEGRIDAYQKLNEVVVSDERCWAIAKKDDRSFVPKKSKSIKYSGQLADFIRVEGDRISVRQDGPNKRGRPSVYPLGASRSALSTIYSAEYPHLYALKELLSSIQFLQIDPQAARRPSDRLAQRQLLPDASNLATVLAKIREETTNKDRVDGIVSDITTDLASLIPSVQGIHLSDNSNSSEYSFDLRLRDEQLFSARVISDGTLRLLALITLLNDPRRCGILCFEEPENGVHEGRIPALVKLLRSSTSAFDDAERPFQILINTHSPAVMAALEDEEIVAADLVRSVSKDKESTVRTRMRTGVCSQAELPIGDEVCLSRFELDQLLRRSTEAA